MKKLSVTSLLLIALSAMAFFNPQLYIVTGKVTDGKGNPVTGAPVITVAKIENATTNNVHNLKAG